MKPLKLVKIFFTASMIAVVSVINLNMVKQESVSETTLNMLDVMTRAFDESEGGEGGELPACVTVTFHPSGYIMDLFHFKTCYYGETVPWGECGEEERCIPFPTSQPCQSAICKSSWYGGGPA